MSSVHVERAIHDIFQYLEKSSRFKEIKEEVLRTGVYRIDVKLIYGLYARFILDPADRVDNIFIIGTFIDDKFKGIVHFPFKIPTDGSVIPTAKALEKQFHKLSDQYRYRIRKS